MVQLEPFALASRLIDIFPLHSWDKAVPIKFASANMLAAKKCGVTGNGILKQMHSQNEFHDLKLTHARDPKQWL